MLVVQTTTALPAGSTAALVPSADIVGTDSGAVQALPPAGQRAASTALRRVHVTSASPNEDITRSGGATARFAIGVDRSATALHEPAVTTNRMVWIVDVPSHTTTMLPAPSMATSPATGAFGNDNARVSTGLPVPVAAEYRRASNCTAGPRPVKASSFHTITPSPGALTATSALPVIAPPSGTPTQVLVAVE